MMKRILPIIVSFLLATGTTVFAANTDSTDGIAPPPQEIPAPAEIPGGNRQGIVPPQGRFPAREEITPPEAMPTQTEGEMTPPAENAEGETAPQTPENRPGFMGGRMPGNMGNMPFPEENTGEAEAPGGFLGFVKTYTTPIISVILLIFAFIFVKFYKRKTY